VDRYYFLAPAIIATGGTIAMLGVFGLLWLLGRPPGTPVHDNNHSAFFNFFIRFFVWLLRPVERLMLVLHISPNALTVASLFVCAGAGLAIATGHMASAGWLYITAGALDILDGRLARATKNTSPAGAFLDSVSDRWCEIFVFAGFAWFLRDTYWLLAVMLALGGSLMVSYTRARGESLGVTLSSGHMQRPERITIVAIATLVTAGFDAASPTTEYSRHVIGIAMLIVGAGATLTACGRFLAGYRALKAPEVKTGSDTRPAEISAGDPRSP
jgi:phosphatidylglycerophosphate synthase